MKRGCWAGRFLALRVPVVNNDKPTRISIRSITREEKEVNKADTFNGELVNEVVKQMEGRAPIAQAEIGGQQDLTPEQRAKLPYVMAAKLPCLLVDVVELCNEKPAVVGSWKIPERLRRDETNTVFYSLCSLCATRPGVKDLVNRLLTNAAKRQKPAPELVKRTLH